MGVTGLLTQPLHAKGSVPTADMLPLRGGTGQLRVRAQKYGDCADRKLGETFVQSELGGTLQVQG